MRHSNRGFTLIELLVVLGLIGILAAIAVAAYGEHRKRSWEAAAITYMRNWVPAQEYHLQKYGYYADADEQLETPLGVLFEPNRSRLPYNFSIDSAAKATGHWWGRASPLEEGLRHFYIDETGRILSSVSGPPTP